MFFKQFIFLKGVPFLLAHIQINQQNKCDYLVYSAALYKCGHTRLEPHFYLKNNGLLKKRVGTNTYIITWNMCKTKRVILGSWMNSFLPFPLNYIVSSFSWFERANSDSSGSLLQGPFGLEVHVLLKEIPFIQLIQWKSTKWKSLRHFFFSSTYSNKNLLSPRL